MNDRLTFEQPTHKPVLSPI